LYIPLLSANVFHIKKIKNVKRVCPKRINKGQKNNNKVQKMKIYEPQKTKRDHESEKVKMPPLFTFMQNNDCMRLVIHAIIHDSQIV